MKKDFILSGTNDQVFEQLKTTVLPLNWSPVRFEPGKNRLGGVDPTYGKILIYLRTTAPGQVSCTVSAASETAADFIINKVSPPAFDDFFSDSDDDDDAGDSIFDDAPSATNTPAPAAQPTASTPSNPAPSQPPVQNEPWYYKTWVVVLFLIFFWPVGLILMWTGKKFPLAVRIILSVFYAISLIIVLFSGVFLGNLASNAVSSTPSTTVTTTAQTSTSSSTDATIDPTFKEAMDSYEAFFDQYIAFMQTYSQSTDTASMLADYTNYMQQYNDTMTKLNAIDTSKLNSAELAYYTEVTTRISSKLATVATN